MGQGFGVLGGFACSIRPAAHPKGGWGFVSVAELGSVSERERDSEARPERVLLAAFDLHTRVAAKHALIGAGFPVELAGDFVTAQAVVLQGGADVLVVTLDPAGEQLADEVRRWRPALPVIGVPGSAGRAGAPGLRVDELVRQVVAVLSARGPYVQSATARRAVPGPLGIAPAFRTVLSQLEQLAESDRPLCFVGEEGSGRRTLARWLHDRGPAARQAFIELAPGASALPPNVADAGTLYVPHADALSAEDAARCMALCDRAGGVRVLCSVASEVAADVAPLLEDPRFGRILVPPLRDRCEDIVYLATAFGEQAAGEDFAGFTLEAMVVLQAVSWPGNVAQIKRCTEAAVSIADGVRVSRRHLVGSGGAFVLDVGAPEAAATLREVEALRPLDLAGSPSPDDVLPFEAEERRILAYALRAARGNVTRAAQMLRIGRATFYRKIHHYDLHVVRDETRDNS